MGRDPAKALDTAMLTERLAKIFALAFSPGRVEALPAEIVEAETATFRVLRRSAIEGPLE